MVLLRLLIEIDKGHLSVDRILDHPDLIFQNRGRRAVDVEDAGNLPLFLERDNILHNVDRFAEVFRFFVLPHPTFQHVNVDFFGIQNHQPQLFLLCREDFRRGDCSLDCFLNILLIEDGNGCLCRMAAHHHCRKRRCDAKEQSRNNCHL